MKDYKKALQSKGFKATQGREAVLALLDRNRKPQTAAGILAGMRKPKMDQATLYRILEAFERKGMVKKIEFKKGYAFYEIADQAHHHHVICTSCNRMEDIHLPHELEDQGRQIEKQTKFKVQDHTVEFFGLCPDCK
jgi:Fur family transcriptional regulator, ferric uptake regulator